MIGNLLSATKALSTLALGAALLLSASGAYAAECPTVADPQGIITLYPQQLDLPDYQSQAGGKISDNPLFADQVK